MGTRVYIGRLSYHAKEKDVERFFRSYGKIRDIMLKNGYGFVEFEDYRDADDAVYELNGKDLCGERVNVEHARGSRGDDSFRDRGFRGRRGDGGRGGGGRRDKYGPPTRTDHRLIVENLSSRVSWQDLKDYMRQAGEVAYADAHKKHKNEGIIEFASSSDMRNAIEKLDGSEINGRKIRLVEDKPRKRSHSRSRSRSRSKRDSRSRSARSASRSRSRSHSRSRSASKGKKSKSRSATPQHKKSASRSRSRSVSQSHDNGDQDGDEPNDN
jgi:arginine/serine-rich splicing factor 4/5/6